MGAALTIFRDWSEDNGETGDKLPFLGHIFAQPAQFVSALVALGTDDYSASAAICRCFGQQNAAHWAAFCLTDHCIERYWLLSRFGSDLLSHVLRRSTIGVPALNGRVRDGIGCFAGTMTTKPGKEPISVVEFCAAAPFGCSLRGCALRAALVQRFLRGCLWGSVVLCLFGAFVQVYLCAFD